jgi:hypothetical protein
MCIVSRRKVRTGTHFTPKGVSICAGRAGYKHATTTWLSDRGISRVKVDAGRLTGWRSEP